MKQVGVGTLCIALASVTLAVACGDGNETQSAGPGGGFVTTSVVFGEESTQTYVSVLPSLAAQTIDYDVAREFSGWADLWVQGDDIFIAEGDEPVVGRYSLGGSGGLTENGRVSFLNYGSDTAAFWTNVLIAPNKAYYFALDAREVAVWDPERLEITGSFPLSGLEDRGALVAYMTTDRSAVVRGDRLYVPVSWGNWDDLVLSEDSAILVIDTTSDALIDILPVACPDLNVATLDDQGDIYFSNWVYGVAAPAFDRTAPTCAARIRAGQDTIDDGWSLTFAEATGGRQAAAMRYLGDGKALMSVYYDDRVTLTSETDRFAVVDAPNWRFWTLDLTTFAAAEVEGLEFHGGGYYSTRLGETNMLFVPNGDYSATEAFAVSPDGALDRRWTATGWTTRLFAVD